MVGKERLPALKDMQGITIAIGATLTSMVTTIIVAGIIMGMKPARKLPRIPPREHKRYGKPPL